MKHRILVPVDGSEPSQHALDAAVGLARTLDGTVIVCHVVDLAKAAMMTFGNPQFSAGCIDALREEGASIVQASRDRIGTLAGGVETCLLQGNPSEAIVDVARERGVTWIVMGSHGRTGLSRMLVGSVAEGVLRHAPVPVMIVPPERKRAVAQGELAAAAGRC